MSAIMDISKVVQKEEARTKVEECLDMVLKDVASFNFEFEERVRVGMPIYWDFVGVLILWK